MRATYEIPSERSNVDKLAEIVVKDVEQIKINVEEKILKSVSDFCEDKSVDDDMTLVGISIGD